MTGVKVGRAPARQIPLSEHLANLGLVAMALVSYQQLASPACDNQSHSLPSSSTVMAHFPSRAPAAGRLMYLLRNAPFAFWDIFHVKKEDAWVSRATLTFILRFACPFFITADLYSQVAAPLLVYFLRADLFVYHLLLGPSHQPSGLALHAMFNMYPAFDLGYFISLLGASQRVNLTLELAHCAAMAAGLLVLCHWHGHRVPGGVNIAWQMSTRAMVTCATMYLTRATGRLPGSSRPAGRDATAGERTTGSRCKSELGETGGPDCAPGEGSGSGSGLIRGLAVAPDSASTAAQRGAPDPPDNTQCLNRQLQQQQQQYREGQQLGQLHQQRQEMLLPPHHYQHQGRHEARTPRADLPPARWRQCAPRPEQPQVHQGGGCAQPAPLEPAECLGQESAEPASGCERPVIGEEPAAPTPTATAGPVPPLAIGGPSVVGLPSEDGHTGCSRAAAAAAPAVAPRRLPPYRAFIRRQCLCYKIPWAEPEQLSPGYEQRLRDLAASQGYHLAAVYVRRGCVELTMVLEEQLGPSARTADWPPLPLEVAAVIRALGLKPLLQLSLLPGERHEEAEAHWHDRCGPQDTSIRRGLKDRRLAAVQVRSWGAGRMRAPGGGAAERSMWTATAAAAAAVAEDEKKEGGQQAGRTTAALTRQNC